MKRKRNYKTGIVLVLMIFILLTACSGGSSDTTWQEQYDLGMQYLTDGDYSAAVVAFTKAIETEPKMAAVYIARGDAYSAWAEETEAAALVSLPEGDTIEWSSVTVTADDGSTYTLEELYENAVADYEEAIRLIESGEALDESTEDLLEEADEKRQEIEDRLQEYSDSSEEENSGTASENFGVMVNWESSDYVFGSDTILRREISSIVFLNSFENMPTDAWDISTDGDGSVMAWVIRNDDGSYDLYIAGNGSVIAPENSQSLFAGYAAAIFIDLSYLDTSNVTDMSYFFDGCHTLNDMNIGNINTENVTTMLGMFKDCYRLENLNLNNFDTENVLDMSWMFSQCYSLQSLNISTFKTGKVTDMSYMFYECRSLEAIDVSNFETDCVTNMSCMFSGCEKVTYLDVSNFNTSNVANMDFMFFCCYGITELDISNFDFSSIEEEIETEWKLMNMLSIEQYMNVTY